MQRHDQPEAGGEQGQAAADGRGRVAHLHLVVERRHVVGVGRYVHLADPRQVKTCRSFNQRNRFHFGAVRLEFRFGPRLEPTSPS